MPSGTHPGRRHCSVKYQYEVLINAAEEGRVSAADGGGEEEIIPGCELRNGSN